MSFPVDFLTSSIINRDGELSKTIGENISVFLSHYSELLGNKIIFRGTYCHYLCVTFFLSLFIDFLQTPL